MSELRGPCNPECKYGCFEYRCELYSTEYMTQKTPNILMNEIYLKINGLHKDFYVIVEDQLTQSFVNGMVSRDLCEAIRVNGPRDPSNSTSKSNELALSGCKNMVRFLMCRNNPFFSQTASEPGKFIELRLKSRIIGIVDRDFEKDEDGKKEGNVQYNEKQFSGLFKTETNDIETYILKYGGLKTFIEMNFNAASASQIQDEIISQSSMIGLARYLNENNIPKRQFKLNFKHFKSSNLYCKYISKKQLMTEKQAQALVYENPANLTKSKVFNMLYEGRLPNRKKLFGDLWEICQGHDTMKILLCYQWCCSKAQSDIREREISEKISDIALHDLSYRDSIFIKALIQWEKRFHPSHFGTSDIGKIFGKTVYGKC